MKYCKDCEPAQESHFLAYINVLLDFLTRPIYKLIEILFKKLTQFIIEKSSIPLMNLFVFLNLGYYSYRIDSKISLRGKCLWEEAEKRGIKIKEFYLWKVRDIFIAEYDGKIITYDGLPNPKNNSPKSLQWVDNKGIMKKKFKKENLPIADGGTAWNLYEAIKIFNRIKKPVITKPSLGSRSRHTTIHINTKEELINAYKKVKVISPFVVIEEELKGDLYRGTVIGKVFRGAVRRDPPYVIGNGINTVEELKEKENERKERQGPVFHKIIIDKEALLELKRQNIKLEDIPEKDRKITFSQKTSRACGGSTEEVTNIIHPENIEMLEHIAKYLDNDIIGIDFIIEDITKPWNEQEYSGIIECNSLPFIDLHHYVMYGEPQNIAGKIWDLIFPESKGN